ncbi:serine/threonine protein kinase [Candidatus Bathyarchaeota archaeon]|nr:serine/threonine protein kinase [Candidatus Bathyarchaeota archaeon]
MNKLNECPLNDKEINLVLCWPKYDADKASKRIKELSKTGITKILSFGKQKLLKINVLGKGHTGIVLLAKMKSDYVALKILRTDADRKNMSEEAKMLQLANSIGVAPKLLGFSENFLIMEYLEGPFLRDWLNTLTPDDALNLRRILKETLHQARSLDKIGLDHGELVRLRRHIILYKDSPVYIDFESASINRRVANVTTVAQSLFLNNSVSTILSKIIPEPNKEDLLEALKKYSKEENDENFIKILEISVLT